MGITKRRIIILILAFVITFGIVLMAVPNKAYADAEVDFTYTNVLDDLRTSTTGESNFDIRNYPYDESKKPQVINFVEYCYSYKRNLRANYGLYVYVYNPQGLNFDTGSKASKIQMAVEYNEEGQALRYEKFSLRFCNKSTESNYNNLFYKFKVVDRKIDGKDFYDRVNSNERRYDVSGIELVTYGENTAQEYGVNGIYKFTGYAKGYGPDDKAENTLACNVEYLETIQLDVHKTYYRTGEYKKNHKHDLTSVYFSVPQRYFDVYGNLQKIKAEWYEYQTTPIVITSSSKVYNEFSKQIGKLSSEIEGDLYSLYTNEQKVTGANGHYYTYDFAYMAPGVADERLTRLFYVFSTNGASISKYVLSGSRLEEYILGYDKTFLKGEIEIPGKVLSADLFETELASDRKSVPYVEGDIHHKLVNFDANDTFNMLSYNELNSGWDKFFDTIFGLKPSNIDQSYKGISPIHIVTDEERNDSDIAKKLLIDGSDTALNEFKQFYDDEKAKECKTVLFRFAQTDYRAFFSSVYNESKGDQICHSSSSNTAVAQESVFFNFDIIELTFCKDGVYTVIPVVSNPIDIVNDIVIPQAPKGLDWLMWLLLLIVLVFVLIILGPYLPIILKVLWIVISFPFKVVGIVFKSIKVLVKKKRKKKKEKKDEKDT